MSTSPSSPVASRGPGARDRNALFSTAWSRLVKVYPDNDVFSAMMAKSKPDMTEIENAAILRIRSAEMRGELVLVTSEVHKREIDKVPEQHRAPYQSAFGALPQIEFVEDRTLLGFNTILRAGVVVYPLFEYEAIVRVLWDLGVKQLDAHHLVSRRDLRVGVDDRFENVAPVGA